MEEIELLNLSEDEFIDYRAELDWDKTQLTSRLNQLRESYNQAHQAAAREESFSSTRGSSAR